MDKFILNKPNRELTEVYFTTLMKYSLVFFIAWKQFPEIEGLVIELNKHIA